MIKIYIQGLKDGVYDIELVESTSNIPDLYPEFFGDITLKGSLKVVAKRYYFKGIAQCYSHLVCDLSLTEYDQLISVPIELSFLADNYLYKQGKINGLQETNEIIIQEDAKYLDLTDEVREELALNLPMRRRAPGYEDKSVEDLYPEYSATNQPKRQKKQIDERWEILKSIKIKKKG